MSKSLPNDISNSRFEDLYEIATEYAKTCSVSFRESFDQVLEFRDQKYSKQEIRREIFKNENYNEHSGSRARSTNPNYDVWVLFGETGQGKSTFINSLYGNQVAPEGRGINSKTEDVNLYPSEETNILFVDTPGLFSTGETTNRAISDKIVAKVQERLQENSHIKAIFFTWCPNFSLKLKLDKLLKRLKETLGPSAIDSVVFLINIFSNHWTPMYEEAVTDFKKEIASKGLSNPIFVADFKLMNPSKTIKQLKEVLESVKPFREKDFENYRIKVCSQKYISILEEDTKKEKERQLLESTISDRLKKEMQQRENRHSEDIQRMQESHKQELKDIEQSNYNRIKQINEDNSRQHQVLEQEVHNLLQQFNSSISPYPFYSSYSPPSYAYYTFPSNINTGTTSTSNSISSSKEGKFYKPGQFIPGPGHQHAPKGGIWIKPSTITSTPSAANSSGGAKFYKGGQFTPGGGRAPKGGKWA